MKQVIRIRENRRRCVSQRTLTAKHHWSLNVAQKDQTKRNPARWILVQFLWRLHLKGSIHFLFFFFLSLIVNWCLNGWSNKEGGTDHICAAAPPPVLSICTGPSCYISPPLAIFILLSAPHPTPPPHLLFTICHIFLPSPPPHPTLLPLLSPLPQPPTSSPAT